MSTVWVEVWPWGCAKDGICESTTTAECVHAELVPESCYEHGCPDAAEATPWVCVHRKPVDGGGA